MDKLITQYSSAAVLNGEDCTFTTAQSPAEFERCQVLPDPLKSAWRTAGPTRSRSPERNAI
jgi:hypothetical protein